MRCLVWILLVPGLVGVEEFVAATLTGKVMNVEGKVVPGATVLLNRTTDAQMDTTLSWRAVTDAQGQYALRLGFEAGKTVVWCAKSSRRPKDTFEPRRRWPFD